MIRGVLAIFVTIAIVCACLFVLGRCTAAVVCGAAQPVRIETTTGPAFFERPAYKRFKKYQDERRKQEERNKKNRPAPTYDGTGRPRFILE